MDVEETRKLKPDSSAVRTTLWRALHAQIDPPPHVIQDEIGLRLAAPGEGWRARPDMDPRGTAPFRASIVGRARFVEDLVAEQIARGVDQYVLLGAGLDSFAQRHLASIARLDVFEIDRPGPQAWKRDRLVALGLAVPDRLHLVPVDFEASASWWDRLVTSGFRADMPAVVASAGVSMYLTREANVETLRAAARLARGSTFVMTFLWPMERTSEQARGGLEQSARGARASGTPFLSFFEPADLISLAREAGFREAEHVSAQAITDRYFAGREDGLRPPDRGEEILVARI